MMPLNLIYDILQYAWHVVQNENGTGGVILVGPISAKMLESIRDTGREKTFNMGVRSRV